MRILFAIPFSYALCQRMEAVNRALELGAQNGSFTRAENFHLTLAMLSGEYSLSPFIDCVNAISSAPFSLTLSGWGAIPGQKGIRYYLKVRPCHALDCLQKEVTGLLTAAGYQPDVKRLLPHITLVRDFRAKSGFIPSRVLEQLPAQNLPVERVSLLETTVRRGKSYDRELYGKNL